MIECRKVCEINSENYTNKKIMKNIELNITLAYLRILCICLCVSIITFLPALKLSFFWQRFLCLLCLAKV